MFRIDFHNLSSCIQSPFIILFVIGNFFFSNNLSAQFIERPPKPFLFGEYQNMGSPDFIFFADGTFETVPMRSCLDPQPHGRGRFTLEGNTLTLEHLASIGEDWGMVRYANTDKKEITFSFHLYQNDDTIQNVFYEFFDKDSHPIDSGYIEGNSFRFSSEKEFSMLRFSNNYFPDIHFTKEDCKKYGNVLMVDWKATKPWFLPAHTDTYELKNIVERYGLIASFDISGLNEFPDGIKRDTWTAYHYPEEWESAFENNLTISPFAFQVNSLAGDTVYADDPIWFSATLDNRLESDVEIRDSLGFLLRLQEQKDFEFSRFPDVKRSRYKHSASSTADTLDLHYYFSSIGTGKKNIPVETAIEYFYDYEKRHVLMTDTLHLVILPGKNPKGPFIPEKEKKEVKIRWYSSDTTVYFRSDSSCFAEIGFFINDDELDFKFILNQEKNTCISDYKLELFNRWGEVFAETGESYKIWYFSDEIQRSRIYWKLNYKDDEGKNKYVDGTLCTYCVW